MSDTPRDLLRRLEARLAHLKDLRAEAEEMRAEMLAADRELGELGRELVRVREELATGPSPERRAELGDYAKELRAAADRALTALRERGWEARVELHEIEMGIATDDALRLRAEAQRLSDEHGHGPGLGPGPDEPLP